MVIRSVGGGSEPPVADGIRVYLVGAHSTGKTTLARWVRDNFGLPMISEVARGVLAEMELPTDRLAPALFGFNAGVEIGQLGVVIVVWPLLRALARWQRERLYRPVIEAGSAAIFALGLFWFVTRTFG